MKDRILDWLELNRRPVGYTVGGLIILAGVGYALQGSWGMAVLWIVLGSFLVWDTHQFR